MSVVRWSSSCSTATGRDKYDRNLETMRPNCIEGSGGELLDPLLPVDEKRDYIIKKRRYSAFYGTDLDLVLREHGIESVVVVGTKTNWLHPCHGAGCLF